jgi:signal transduction histidine kinase
VHLAVLLKVEVKEKSNSIQLEDDAVGFNPELKTSGNGMKTIRRRGQELGASFFCSQAIKERL